MRKRLIFLLLILGAATAAVYRYMQPAVATGAAAVDEARTRILGLRGEWTKVARGDFEIAIQEDGELRPVQVTSLTFLIPGKIDLLIPEGKEVKKGDSVIALETKDLREEIQHIQEDLDTADVALAQAIQTRELETKRLALEFHTEMEKADYAVLKDRETAAHPNDVEKEQAKNTLESAQARLNSSKGDLDLCKPLYDKGFYAKQDYDLKLIAFQKAGIEQTRADMQARILRDGALEYDRAMAKIDVEYSVLGWKYKLIDNSDQIEGLTAKVKSAERIVNACKRKLAKRNLELEHSTLHAPHDGVVVYRTMGYRNNKKPEVGERVSPWIAPIDLPNYERMKVRTQVPESLIRKTFARTPPEDGLSAQPGSEARVQINTLPGIVYPAHVTWIDGWARDRNSKLSDADIKAQGLSGVKVFDVEVELDVSDPKHLREGFRASVDFPEETLKNVIAIPEQAVSTIDGMSSVMVMESGSPTVRKIELGRTSLGKVVAVSGLNAGDRIYVPTIVQQRVPETEGGAKKPTKGGKPGDKNPDRKPSLRTGANTPEAAAVAPSKSAAAVAPSKKTKGARMTSRPDDVFRPVSRWQMFLGAVFQLMVLAALGTGGWFWYVNATKSRMDVTTTVLAERKTFTHTLRRQGTILPLNEERIYTKLAGTIMELANEGALAQKGDVVMKLDPRPYEDTKAEYEELIGEQGSDYRRLHEESLKILNLAREDVKSYELRLKLEQLRLDEIKKGPTPTDEVNAQMNLENNKILLIAKQEELTAIEGLAKLGYSSIEELRQKQTESVEQHFKVLEMDIAHRKLNIIDPIKVADQELKVKEAIKTRNSAKEKVELLERNMKRDDDRYQTKRKRDEERLKELKGNIEKTTYRAPCAGLVVPRRAYYGFRFAPGREVYDGMEILTIPDLSKMKVKLTVDEGHVSRITKGMKTQVVPAGWTGKPFEGIVTLISEQGRDEFEQFQEDTTAISGTANRKVFDVEVALNDHSPILRLGLRCDIEIVLNQIQNAVVVPRAALIKQKDGDVIAPIAGLNGGTQKRKIKLRDESDLWAAVDGIEPGERLVLAESDAN